jgi:PPE-repeat protein
MFCAMEFTTLPPEVVSALIHSGPGAESLIEASGAWQRLGTNLEDSAGIYSGLLSSLTEAWRGPSSLAMAQAVDPYLTWLRSTAQQSRQTASSALAAAAAFSVVQAAVVPVSQVAANRTRLAHLLATNTFGINLPAIAETEDQYQVMWADNSAAMSRYQAASTQATRTLPQFSSPRSITNPNGVAAQANAAPTTVASSSAARAAASSSAARAAASPSTARAAAAAAAPAADPPSDPINLGLADPTTGYFGLANQWGNQFISSGYPFNMLSYIAQTQTAQGIQSVGSDIGTGLSEGEGALGTVPGGLGALGAAGLSAEPTAAIGAGVSIGQLTAPPAVVGLLPATQAPVQLASAATPLTAADPGFPMLPPLMPPPISAGSGWRKRKQQKYEDIAIGKELKGTFMPRPPSAG